MRLTARRSRTTSFEAPGVDDAFAVFATEDSVLVEY
jgi:hypothetical protein